MAEQESALAEVETYTAPAHGWTCFHCGETFRTKGGARDHFGNNEMAEPGCVVKVEVGAERGWLMKIRRLEAEVDRLRHDIDVDYTSHLVFEARLKGGLMGHKAFRDCRTLWDVFCIYDSTRGRALAAQEELERVKADNDHLREEKRAIWEKANAPSSTRQNDEQ